MKTSKPSTSPRPTPTSERGGVSREPPAYGIAVLDGGARLDGSASPGRRGLSLPAPIATKMARAFASDFSDVRVHLDGSAARLGAQAFTRGRDIHFAPGRYDPHAAQGQALIGHELAHVVQQSQGRVPASARWRGHAINTDPALEREADESGQRATRGQPAGLRGPLRHAPASADVVQGFGIDSRTWKDVTAVRNLSKGAYLVSAGNERVIIKLASAGKIAIEPGEGPTQETLGAGLANAVGVPAARTLQMLGKDVEGRTIIATLHALGGEARALAASLAKVESFLVMEFVAGDDLEHAGPRFLSMTREQRETLYASLGRMYAFDVFVDNTDRFIKLNLGNMMVRADGELIGIDQMIQGVTDLFAQHGISAEAAKSRLAPMVDPGKRRAMSLELFDSISRGMGDGSYIDPHEALPFAIHFELGVLEMIGRIAALDPGRVDAVVAQLPVEAQAAVEAVGLTGLGHTQSVFAEFAAEAAEQAEQLGGDLRGRTLFDREIKLGLATLRGERQVILERWRTELETLHAKWRETEKWMFGAASYWADKQRKADLTKLAEFRIGEFEAAYKAAMIAALQSPNSVLLREQATAWFGEIGELREAIVKLLDSPSEIGRALVHVHRTIRRQFARPSLALSRP
ncbi:eCIS core domain-containing protein [Nannocystaceae bacterium ST9]